MAMESITRLKALFKDYLDVRAAVSVLGWDQEVMMPPKGAAARGAQLAALSAMAHRLLTAPEMARALDDAERDADSEEARRLVAEMRFDYTRATQVPEAFVRRFTVAQSRAYEAWTRARSASDFHLFLPHLRIMVDLLREKSEFHGYSDTPYDALIEDYERGMTTAQIAPLFAELAPKQSAIVARIAAQGAPEVPAWLDRVWDEQAQSTLTLRVLRDMGYDFDAGRQDKSVHPFTTSFGLYDVRITTRFSPDEPFSALMGSMHEGGHALYDQGFRPEDEGTVFAEGASLGLHESQSRMWENLIGRGQAFWRYALPIMREHFPDLPRAAGAEDLYRAVNRVEPSFIRVEADECTYNLHIILRFEIERALIEGRLDAAEVPEVWNAKMKAYLGLDVPDDARGCLQDIHWSHGSMGYFPTYALGNLYAAQLFEQIRVDLPDLDERVARGEFGPLLDWLRKHVHCFGRRKSAVETVRDATGREPGPDAFLRYLETKFGAL